MRFILVIDNNDLDADPRRQIADVLEVAREHVLDGDRSRACIVRGDVTDPPLLVGGFELTLGETAGEQGWRNIR